MSKNTLILLTGALFFWLSAPVQVSGAGTGEQEESALTAFVSIAPQAFFLDRIAGGRVSVQVLVKPGQDPHTFDPTPSTMARLSEADLYFRIGVEFEDVLIEKIEDTTPDLLVVDCRKNIVLRDVEEHDHDDHGDDDHGDDDHVEGTDPHIWLSLNNAMIIAKTMFESLVSFDPAGAEMYSREYEKLLEELTSLDRELQQLLEPVKGNTLFVFHPSFGYFADDYGLEQVAVETGGNEPSARQLASLIDEAREHGARVIFVQPQFSRKSAQAVAEAIDGKVVSIDPLAGNYIENMRYMAKAVEEGLRGSR